jgi:hypothetical protein
LFASDFQDKPNTYRPASTLKTGLQVLSKQQDKPDKNSETRSLSLLSVSLWQLYALVLLRISLWAELAYVVELDVGLQQSFG